MCVNGIPYALFSIVLTTTTQKNNKNYAIIQHYEMPRLSENERLKAIGMLEAGSSQRDVARQFNVHRNTILCLWQRWQQTNAVRDHPRSGRPRVTNNRQDNWIRTTHLRNRFQPATVTARSIPGLRRTSSQTVRRRLRCAGIVARRPARRPILTGNHRQPRLQWFRQRLRWTAMQWGLFTDETRFTSATAMDGFECTDVEVNVTSIIVSWKKIGSRTAALWYGVG